MRSVTPQFLATVQGPYTIAAEAILVDSCPQFGTQPTGTSIPIVDGSVTFQSLSDIHATLQLTVPGDYWSALQPFGVELFIRCGVQYSPGNVEMCPLGYYRVEQITQANAPYDTIVVQGLDRMAQVEQNQLTFPLPISDGNTHRSIFEACVNGIPIPQQSTFPGLQAAGNAAYPGSTIPITWTSYNPDTTLIIGDQIIQDSTYQYLSQLIQYYNASMMRFTDSGEMLVYSVAIDANYPVLTLTGGTNGQIIKSQRLAKRTDVHNCVTSYGTDPTALTDFIISYNNDPASPLAFNKTTYPQFGPAPTYYSSPLLQTNNDVLLAGQTLLERYQMLPLIHTFTMIPNPAIECNDVIDVIYRPGLQPVRCIVDTIILPLSSSTPATLTTRIPTATEGYGLGLGFLGP